MQDLKTGHLIHASPRAQFYGQLVGSALSILVTTTAYTFYTRAYAIPGPEFPTPTAYASLLVVHRTFSVLISLAASGVDQPREAITYVWFSKLFYISHMTVIGDGSLPPRSKEAMLIFTAVFACIAGFKSYGFQYGTRWAKWLPSGIAFAIGFLNTPSFSLARL